MDKEQIDKHKEVIKWFCDNVDKGVWNNTDGSWYLNNCPLFRTDTKYIQNDEYAELRKAKADGKTLEYSANSPSIPIEDCTSWSEDFTLDTILKKGFHVRIKPDVEFKVGDWVSHTPHKGKTIMCMSEELLKYSTSLYELWKPQENEMCIFWDNLNDVYRIAKFKKTEVDRDCEYIHLTIEGTYYVNIAPLEFAKTLRDK